jgi:hypothetical protein
VLIVCYIFWEKWASQKEKENHLRPIYIIYIYIKTKIDGERGCIVDHGISIRDCGNYFGESSVGLTQVVNPHVVGVYQDLVHGCHESQFMSSA